MEHRATGRVLDVFSLLATNREGLTLTELSAALDAPKSSLLPILKTMLDRGYLRTSKKDKNTYLIGQEAYLVGNSYSSSHSAKDVIRERMLRMVSIFDETSQLGILSGNCVFYVVRVESKNPITLRSQVDKVLPAYCTGLGKALLSEYSMEQLKALYPKGLVAYTPQTISNLESLNRELQLVRETGFAYEHSELVEQVECVAVPLRYDGHVIAALSFSMPAYRTDREKVSRAMKLLDQCRSEIESYFEQFHISSSAMLL